MNVSEYRPTWMTTNEVAKELRVSRTTIYRMVQDKKLTPRRWRGIVRYSREEVDLVLQREKAPD